ncbi:MAG: orotidine-5'-phosphate decarboxylase [Halobacteria archaeon]
MKRRTGLVVALDVPTGRHALSLARALDGLADGFKIGLPLLMGESVSVLRDLRRRTRAPLIADLKVADIPETGEAMVERALRAGASAAIVQGFSGRDTVERCVAAARRHRGEVFVVAEMSHPGGATYLAPAAGSIARAARSAGAAGLIAPATRPARIRRLKTVSGLPVLAPGVGAQGGDAARAVRAGADWLIVGRSLVRARNPRPAAERLVEAIRRAGRAG